MNRQPATDPKRRGHSAQSSAQSSAQQGHRAAGEPDAIEQEVAEIKQQLKSMPYELILKHRQALKAPQQTRKQSNKLPTTPKMRKNKPIAKQGRAKEEPLQLGIRQKHRAKDKVVFESRRKKTIDPRFEAYAGSFNPDLAMKSYDFIPRLQQAEIQELRGKLKGKSRRGARLHQEEREVLQKEYNKVTSEYRQGQLVGLQQASKKQLAHSRHQNYRPSKGELRKHFEAKKLEAMAPKDRERKLKEGRAKARRREQAERRETFKSGQRGRQ